MLLHFSYGTGNYVSTSRSNSGLLGGSVAECDRLGEESGSLAMIGSVPNGTATVAVQYREDTAETC